MHPKTSAIIVHLPLFVLFTVVSPKTPLGNGTAGFLEVATEDDEEDIDEAEDEEVADVKEAADEEELETRIEADTEGEADTDEEFNADDDPLDNVNKVVGPTTELDAKDVTEIELVEVDVVSPTAELELELELVTDVCGSFPFGPLCNACA